MTGSLKGGDAVTAWVFIAVTILSAGCGRAGPDVQMIRGVLTLDGAPVEGVAVVFTPEDQGLMAAGKTDADGAFVLNASLGARFGEGTTVGKYIVTVSKLTPYKIDRVTGEPTKILLPEPKQLMPRVYTTISDSPLRASVSKGLNEFRFELSSRPVR